MAEWLEQEPSAILNSPYFSPRLPAILAFERDDAMKRERICVGVDPPQQQVEQAGEVGQVAGDQQIARLTAQSIPDP